MDNISSISNAVLVLEDGTSFHGYSIGAKGTRVGEICFNTGMTGYQEIFTDPSYHRQVVVMTNVHIGNYGVLSAENESSGVQISGLVCRNFANQHSRLMADDSLNNFMVKNGLVGISDVDTRMLVRHIRKMGAMNCIISSEIKDVAVLREMLKEVPSMEGLNLAADVSTTTPYFFGEEGEGRRIAAIDFGVKSNILRSLADRGAFVKIFPANCTLEDLLLFKPDAFFLSNGPGDPSAMTLSIELVKQIVSLDKPVFGICLGHQLIALAFGLSTFKLHQGHRGINQPVLNTETGRAEVTSQNHGFGVLASEIEKFEDIIVTHVNLNDGTVEGLSHKSKPIFSVQYHPEAAPGPHDSRYLFDKFIRLIQS
jgi:carbamoyl-phosphate synthase small subunit